MWKISIIGIPNLLIVWLPVYRTFYRQEESSILVFWEGVELLPMSCPGPWQEWGYWEIWRLVGCNIDTWLLAKWFSQSVRNRLTKVFIVARWRELNNIFLYLKWLRQTRDADPDMTSTDCWLQQSRAKYKCKMSLTGNFGTGGCGQCYTCQVSRVWLWVWWVLRCTRDG